VHPSEDKRWSAVGSPPLASPRAGEALPLRHAA
jgi:hypothetical protein